jgi:Ca2+-binding EF-hand superfamily protein
MRTFYGALALLLASVAHAQQQPNRGGGAGTRMDTNGDGKISREEFPGPKELFDQFDRDKNNFLSPVEREAMRSQRRQGGGFRRPGQGGTGDLAEQLFRAADADSDKKLSAKEWQAYFEKILTSADADKNGQLSAEEWLAWQRRQSGTRQRPDRGPRVGMAAPKVKAEFLTQKGTVEFSKIKRHTVVVFGSYT